MKKTIYLFMIPIAIFTFSIIFSCNKNDENKTLENIVEKGCLNEGVLETIDGCQLFMPNIFTPNGDGLNDYLTIVLNFYDSTNYKGNITVTIVHNNLGIIHAYQKNVSDEDHSWGRYNLAAWDGKNSDNRIVPGIYQYEVAGKINGIDFNYSGELTLITDRTFFEHCQKCDPLISGDPSIDCAD